MPSRQLPNLDLTGFFDLGEDGWNDEMDLNLLKLSVLVQGGVQDKLAGELVSPVSGDIIILDEAHPTNANNVAVYDNGAWVYFAPSEGWLLYNQAQDYYEKFDGTVWAELATGGGGGGIPDAPSDGTTYGRQDGAWVAVSNGGSGGSSGPASGAEGDLPDQSFGAAFIDMTTATFNRNEGFTATATGLQVPRAGWYVASMDGKWDANTGLGRQVLIRGVHATEGNKDFRHSQPADSIHNDPWMSVTGLFYLEAGDEIQYYAANNDSATFFRGIRFSAVAIEVGSGGSGGGEVIKRALMTNSASHTLPAFTDDFLPFDTVNYEDETGVSVTGDPGVFAPPAGADKVRFSFGANKDEVQFLLQRKAAGGSFVNDPDGLRIAVGGSNVAGGQSVSFMGPWLPFTDGDEFRIYARGEGGSVANYWFQMEVLYEDGSAGTVTSGGVEIASFEQAVAANTGGGQAVSGAWTTRPLAEQQNGIAGVSIASNQITLPAGTYRASGGQEFYRTNYTTTRIHNVTDDVTLLTGTTSFINDPDIGANSLIQGTFTLAAEKVIEFQYFASSAAGSNINTLGVGSGNPVASVFAKLDIEKIG